MIVDQIITRLPVGELVTIPWPAGDPRITKLAPIGKKIAVCVGPGTGELTDTAQFLVLLQGETLRHAARHIGGGFVPRVGRLDVYRIGWWDDPAKWRLQYLLVAE